MAATFPLKFKTIAVTTDFSESAALTLRYAQAVARLHGSTLLVIHVIDPVAYAFPGGPATCLSADTAARDELRKIEAEASRQGIATHSVVQVGDICERILETVEDHHADLLILGTKARTEIGHIALGMVARRLLVKSPCPILTVSPSAAAMLSWAGMWRRVLIATDFSPASLEALTLGHQLAHNHLTVLHAAECDMQVQCATSRERLRFLAPFNESHTVPVEHLVSSGPAASVITRTAEALNPDLIVLGAPEKELSVYEIPSSTVLQVVGHAACPVLLVPAARRREHADHECAKVGCA